MNARLYPIAALVLGILLLFTGFESSFAQPPFKASQAVRDRLTDAGRTRVIVQLDIADEAQPAGRSLAESRQARRAEIAVQRQRLRASLRGALADFRPVTCLPAAPHPRYPVER